MSLYLSVDFKHGVGMIRLNFKLFFIETWSSNWKGTE